MNLDYSKLVIKRNNDIVCEGQVIGKLTLESTHYAKSGKIIFMDREIGTYYKSSVKMNGEDYYYNNIKEACMYSILRAMSTPIDISTISLNRVYISCMTDIILVCPTTPHSKPMVYLKIRLCNSDHKRYIFDVSNKKFLNMENKEVHFENEDEAIKLLLEKIHSL